MSKSPQAHLLAAFLPLDRLCALSEGLALPEQSTGSVLFTDISGFVSFSTALSQHFGTHAGAEHIRNHLNRLFDDIVSHVHAYGGSVISFSGDAITCFFVEDDGQHASQAAQAIRASINVLPAVDVGGQVFQLRVKSVITVGRVHRYLTGDDRVQKIDVLVGEAVTRNAGAASGLEANEVLLSEEVETALRWTGVRMVNGVPFRRLAENQSLPAKALDNRQGAEVAAESLEPWILKPLRSRLLNGADRFIDEIKPGTSLFMCFEGLDFEADDQAGRKLDRLIARVQRIANDFNGHVIQVSAEDKGNYLYIAFGAFVSYGKEVEHALKCALELKSYVDSVDFFSAAGFGIGYGRSWAGTYGAQSRKTFGVLGEQVNLAARLMQRAADGEILVSEEAARQIERIAELVDLGAIKVKGSEEAKQVYAAIGVRQAQAGQSLQANITTLMGREAEQKALSDLLAEFHQSPETHCAVIEGEAGIGKSSLLDFVMQQAGNNEQRLCVTAANVLEQATPYFLWRQLLPQLAGVVAEDWKGLKIWIEQIAKEDMNLAQYAGLLNELLPVELEVHTAIEALSENGRSSRLREVLLTLTGQACKERKLLLLIEDAHWLDSGSWSMLQLALNRLGNIMVVMTTRSVEPLLEPAYRSLLSQAYCRHFPLAGLPPAQIENLIKQRLAVAALPPAVSQLVNDKAQGNPFFSEELAYAMRDAGVLVIENGMATLPSGEAALRHADLPVTVEAVVNSRLDKLSDAQLLVMKVASVIGRVFPYKTLKHIHPGTPADADLLYDVDICRQLDITPLESPEPDLRYIFKHAITQEVVYGRLTNRQKSPIHRSMAQWFEANYKDEARATYYQQLAHHWRQAEQFEQAARYLQLAGERAMLSGSFAEARTIYSELMALNEQHRLIDDAATISNWEDTLAIACYSLGDIVEALEYAKAVLKTLGRPFPETRLALKLAILKEILIQLLHLLLPGKRLITKKITDETVVVCTRAYFRLALIFFVIQKPETIPYTSITRLNLATYGVSRPILARVYTSMATTAQIAGFRWLGARYLSLAQQVVEEIIEASEPDNQEGGRSIDVCLYMMAQGDLATSIEYGERSTVASIRSGNYDEIIHGYLTTQIGLVMQGSFRQAIDHLDKFAQHLDNCDPGAQLNAQKVALIHHEAECRFFLGDMEKANALMDVLDEVFSQDQARVQSKVAYHMCRVIQGLQLARFEQACLAANELLNVLPRRPYAANQARSYVLLAEVPIRQWEDTGQRPDDIQLLKEGLRRLKRFTRLFPVTTSRLSLLRGRLLMLKGKTYRGHKAIEQAVLIARRMKLPYDESLAELALARCYPAASAERVHHAQRAKAMFQNMGLAIDEKRADRLVAEQA